MRYNRYLLAAALALGLSTPLIAQESSAPAAAKPEPVHHLDKCPKNVADFENSDASRSLVEKCLGRPTQKSPGHGDDTIYQYVRGSVILVFVFDHSGAMTHFRGYQQN